MEKKKIAVRLCAFSLAASLFAADVMPALGAVEPKQPAVKVQTAGSEQPMDKPQTVGSEQPTDKPQTTEPEQPTDNPQPAEPEQSTGKPQPAEPEQPSDEIQTVEPEQPSDEIQPAEPEQPSDKPPVDEADAEAENLQPEQSDSTAEETEMLEETSEGPEFFSVPQPGEVSETTPDAPEEKDGLIYVNGVVYSGYYLDSAGLFCLVSNGTAEPFCGTVSEGTEYYSSADQKMIKLAKQTVYVAGKTYTGYYLDNGVFYLVSDGAAEPVFGTVKAGTEYYSSADQKTLKLDSQTVYVEGKAYTGYYLENNILYLVSNGTAEVKSGTLNKGTKYYSFAEQGMTALPDQTVFVQGKIYTGYYLDSRKKMYKVKQGIRTLHTGTLKAKAKYYSYNEAKTKKLSKKTLYVKGKVYTGYYLNSQKKLYKAKQGTCTLHTGTVKAGVKYFNYNTGKKKKLSKDTLYVKGKVYTGYFLDGKKKLYYVKKGTRVLQTGIVNAGTKYYNYQAKKTGKLSKDTLYVKGKVYSGYYLDAGTIMYSVSDGTCTPVSAALNAGTSYYSFNEGKMLALSNTTVYINGKAMEGMSPESLATLQRAQAVVASITNDGMTREEKLRVCFDYVKVAYPEIKPRIPHYLGMDWPVIYANDMFINGAGNCCSYAAAFAYMAKAIGYEEVYCCNSGGHGWAEIDGLVYDPEWSKWHHVYNYFALSYDTPTDQGYKGAIGAGKPWMRVKI